MSRMFLHETQGFKDLLNIVAVNERSFWKSDLVGLRPMNP